jgi:hypothetical protein
VRDAGAALEWPERASLPVTDLEDTATVRLALGVCAKTLARKPAAESPAEDRVGRIVLSASASASASRAGRAWTDEVIARQERGLKHRADDETRTSPIPPVLGRLRAHIKRFGTTLDGRVFRTARAGILQDSGYNEVWDQIRREALTPA